MGFNKALSLSGWSYDRQGTTEGPRHIRNMSTDNKKKERLTFLHATSVYYTNTDLHYIFLITAFK